jgi:ABC-2 type transport system permease protein
MRTSMRASWIFASRTRREILRDPLSILFAVGLPVALIFLMSAMYKNVPEMAVGAPHFAPENLAPGISVLSLSFIALFSGMLVASDRESAFLARVLASPMKPRDFLLGYSLPLWVAAAAQSAVCFGAMLFFGLPLTGRLLAGIAVLIPAGALFTGIGMLLGSAFTYRQVGGVGSILIQVATLAGGTWFDLKLLGTAVDRIAHLLPFAHAVDMSRAAVAGDCAEILPHMLWVLLYAAAAYFAAAVVFRKKSGG